MPLALIRTELEQTLVGRHAPDFRMPAGPPVETVPAGIVEIDRLTGEFRRGRITEIAGTDSSGRTSLMLSTLAQQLHFAAHRGKNLAKATPASWRTGVRSVVIDC